MASRIRPETKTAIEGLLDKLALVVLTIGVVSVGVGLIRVTSQGWHANIFTDLIFFVPMVALLVARRRLPVGVVVATLVGLATVSAIASFMTLGLGTMSFVILTVCCAVVGVVYGIRLGLTYLVGSVLAVAAVGAALHAGWLPDPKVTDPFLLEPQTWITQIVGYAAYAVALLVVTSTLQEQISRSLDEVRSTADELRESEERYRLLADNIRDVLFTTDMELAITYVSPSVERLFGYTPEQALELDLSGVLTPDSHARAVSSFRHYVARASEGDVEVPTLEFECVRRDGSTFWGELTTNFVRDEEGRPSGLQGVLRDVSDRKFVEEERASLERELRQSEKLQAIGQLAGGIAHDFNNQLTSIMAHADLLKHGVADGETVAEHARKILVPARNAADLTGKLLAFARKGAYEHRPVDLHDVINEVVDILSHGIDRRIRVTRHFEATSAVVHGDRTQLQNVFLNLGLNARDAMPAGGEILFRTGVVANDGGTDPPTSSVVVAVTDTGCGMDEVVRERAFEPFFTTKAPGKGTGMGLAAVYGTVASHRGRVEIDSRRGGGTTVSVVLPQAETAAEPRPDTRADRIAPGAGTAMVIDDQESVRTALVDLLEALGFTVVDFAAAADAVAYHAENWRDIDVVVLDLVLADMTGREALSVMQATDPDGRFLLVSGYAADDEVRGLLRSETVEFLEKPFRLSELAESLTRLIRAG